MTHVDKSSITDLSELELALIPSEKIMFGSSFCLQLKSSCVISFRNVHACMAIGHSRKMCLELAFVFSLQYMQ